MKTSQHSSRQELLAVYVLPKLFDGLRLVLRLIKEA
jgi:hypothetical protein